MVLAGRRTESGTWLWLSAAWLCGWALAARLRELPRAPLETKGPISVVVPARNEASRLPRLLALLQNSSEVEEVIVVDDDSSDETTALAAAASARVLLFTPPEGWTGKAWACWQGAIASSGDVLVFLDADVEPAPGFVSRLAATAIDQGGLVSVQPWHRIERVYERLSSCANLIAVLGSGTGGRGWRWWRAPMAFGPAMAMRKHDYFAAGGHAAVRGEVAEDLALAREVDGCGQAVSAWMSGGDVTFRMYPDGMSGLVEGWTKNLAAGAKATPPLRATLVAAWIAGCLRAPCLAVRQPRAGLVAFAVFAAQFAVLLRPVGGFGLPVALLYPVPVVAFVVLFARSAALTLLRRPVGWRGRLVPVPRDS